MRGGLRAAVLALAMAAAGCDGRGADPAAPSSTVAAGARDVTATVSGRRLAGRCVGRGTGTPTVVLEVGMGAPSEQLRVVQDHLTDRTRVCTYDRAGKGGSDPVRTPRPVAEVVADLHAFLRAAAPPPYFLVGLAVGGEIALLYAQAHPDLVAGLVAVNPHPPGRTWLAKARTVESEAQVREFELPDLRGENGEGIEFRGDETLLTRPLPADLPYVVMFDQRCADFPPGLQDVCPRLIRLLAETSQALAKAGEGGRYMRTRGAGRDLHQTNPDLLLVTVDQAWEAAVA
jgi:pimeloyl-ACP methyl ester carboxylesterase